MNDLLLLLLISCLASDSAADRDNMAGRNGTSQGTAIEVYQDDTRATPASTGNIHKKHMDLSEKCSSGRPYCDSFVCNE
jgi:hypothetical protein